MNFDGHISSLVGKAVATLKRRKNSVWVFLFISSGAVWAALWVFYVASFLTPTEFGSYSIAVSVMTFLTVYASHNNGSTIVRHLSYYNNSNQVMAERFRAWAFSSTINRSVFFAISGSLIYSLYFTYFDSSLGASIYYAVFGVFFTSLSFTLMAMLRCEGKPVKAFLSLHFLRYVFFFLFAWTLFPSLEAKASTAIGLEVLSYFGVLLVLLFFSRSMKIFRSFYKYYGVDKKERGEWRKKGFGLTKSALSQQVIGNVDIIIVGIVFGVKEAGFYAIASKVSKVVILGNKAINEYAAPAISSAYESGNYKRVERVAVGACSASLLIAFFFVIALYFTQGLIFKALGSEYAEVLSILWVFIFGQVFNSATGPTGIVLNMTDGESYQTNINIFSAALMVFMFLVCGFFEGGALSAAIVYSLVLVLSNTLKVFYIKKTMGFFLLPRFFKK